MHEIILGRKGKGKGKGRVDWMGKETGSVSEGN